HCYLDNYTDDKKRILTLNQWEHVLSELKKAGVLYVILMGGEAMLNPFFWQISESAAQKGFAVSMITNGLKITTQEVANQIASVGFSHVTVSLYSLNPD